MKAITKHNFQHKQVTVGSNNANVPINIQVFIFGDFLAGLVEHDFSTLKQK
jgi:hypothetical protein